MWETIASFFLKFALREGWLKIESVINAAEIERKARAKDELNKQQAIDDLRGAGNDPAKSVEQNQDDLEKAADRFHERVTP